MNEDSVEQINLFIDGKFSNKDFGDDSQALLDEQDSEVFRVASEVASARKSLAVVEQNDDGTVMLRPALVENQIQKQAAFSTNEPARGSNTGRPDGKNGTENQLFIMQSDSFAE